MYKIIIEKVETVIKPSGRDWEKVGEEIKDGEKINLYDYTPMIDKPIEVETKVLEQTVEELNLAVVIRAINNI